MSLLLLAAGGFALGGAYSMWVHDPTGGKRALAVFLVLVAGLCVTSGVLRAIA